MSEYDNLVERLASIEEDLRDRALERLRDAARSDDDHEIDAARSDEKKLLQARRAIAKAIGVLESLSGDR